MYKKNRIFIDLIALTRVKANTQLFNGVRNLCTVPKKKPQAPEISQLYINNTTYPTDAWTNVTPKILSYLNRNIYQKDQHPLSLIRQRIVNYFYSSFRNSRGNPVFSIHDRLPPIVTVEQNFDSLLIDKDHPSRAKSDCYYVNQNQLLRAHTTAHQADLIRSGLDSFLIVGEVYRRDEIDATHFPVFHQMDAVHLQSADRLFKNDSGLRIFENGPTGSYDDDAKQPCHTLEAVKLMEHELKMTLSGLAKHLFGDHIQQRWVSTFFPFTQPSWELEIFYNHQWLEVLGCGIMRNEILHSAGVHDKIGWAFGLGLERLAMCLYQIPDIRLFWSDDSGFLSQFSGKGVNDPVVYKPVSLYPQCSNDVSFWLPQNMEFSANDFYDIVRSIGGDIIEQVALKDVYTHPKSGKLSHCYKITYRHMERTLTQAEVNKIHKQIENAVSSELSVQIR